MKDLPPVSINFVLGQEVIAIRTWSHVPRIGDEVMLGPTDKAKNRKTPFRVTRVVWGVEGDAAALMDHQVVNVAVEAI